MAEGRRGAILVGGIERIVRMANSFEEAAEIDRRDVAAMSMEERISGVERLRRVADLGASGVLRPFAFGPSP